MRTRTLFAAGIVLLAAACTRTLDTQGLEGQIEDLLVSRGGLEVASIDCPDDIPVDVGATFECTATGPGVVWTVQVTQTDTSGHVEMKIVNAREPDTDPSEETEA